MSTLQTTTRLTTSPTPTLTSVTGYILPAQHKKMSSFFENILNYKQGENFVHDIQQQK